MKPWVDRTPDSGVLKERRILLDDGRLAEPVSDLILYTTEDGRSQIKLRAKAQTVWLSQREMAQFFDVSTDNVGLHLKNIFKDGELNREATTEESSIVQIEGTRGVQRPVTLYNLDAWSRASGTRGTIITTT